jgi:hypothetical protein
MSDTVLSTSDSSSDDEHRTVWQKLRSKSASQLTSHTCDLTVGALPPIQRPLDEASAITAAASQWAPDASGECDRLEAVGKIVVASTTDSDGRQMPTTGGTSVAVSRKLDESKGTGKYHAASPPTATSKSTDGGIAAPEAARSRDVSEVAGRACRPEAGAPELSRKLRVSSKHRSGEYPNRLTSGWRDSAAGLRRSSATAAFPSVMMPSPGGGDDPETRLRKELRELERQRRRREDQKAARRLDRAKAIASERSKYGTGLTPRLEQFFSRILRLQQQPQASDGREEAIKSGKDADRESRSPAVDVCEVESKGTVISGEMEAADAGTSQQIERVSRLKSKDGNNNNSSKIGDNRTNFHDDLIKT